METEREHFACQDNGLAKIFKLIVPSSEKRLNYINVVVSWQVKQEKAHFRLPYVTQTRRVPKGPLLYGITSQLLYTFLVPLVLEPVICK